MHQQCPWHRPLAGLLMCCRPTLSPCPLSGPPPQAVHLITTYQGSGKAFYMGHWEGDWCAGGHGANWCRGSKPRSQACQAGLKLSSG